MSLEVLNFTNILIVQELIDVEGDGMADMVFRCIQEMDIDNRMMVLIEIALQISMDQFCICSMRFAICLSVDSVLNKYISSMQTLCTLNLQLIDF